MKRAAVLSGKKVLLVSFIVIVGILILRMVIGGLSSGGNIKEPRDVVEYLSNLGWEVNPEPTEVKFVEIPGVFSEVYENYNEIQKTNGYDLSRHKAKTAERYTFEVLNFPGKTGVFANVLVINEKVVGGDICSYALDGFMVGLTNS
ncbi:MAG: DUF4830 domain-containing protein [Oscillospiraceae bacterium]|nr:DUF4830 domain-containing protein [Oscillospiraceae bacterium]